MRSRSLVIFCAVCLLLGLAFPFLLSGQAYAADWSQAADDGIAGNFKPADSYCSSMAVYNNQLYAGTSNTTEGCGVWRLEGADWVRVNTPGFGNVDICDAADMAVFNGKLYAGTGNMSSEGCEVWRYDGSDWTCVVGPGAAVGNGFGNGHNSRAYSLAVYGSNLYVGTQNQYDGLEIWRSPDGTSWSQVDGDLFGGDNKVAHCMKVFGSYLYVGTDNYTAGCEVWRTNGAVWTQHASGGFTTSDNTAVCSMEEYGGRLYAGTANGSTGGQVHSTNGVSWLREDDSQLGPQNKSVLSMQANNSQLYVGTYNENGGGQAWRHNGTDWVRVDSGVLGKACMGVYSMEVFAGMIYAGTSGVCEIWSYDGAWTRVSPRGFTTNDNSEAPCMASLGGYLYVGTDSALGCEVWRYDGSAWERVSEGGFGDGDNLAASSMAVFGGTLYVGTRNYWTGCQVWRLAGSSFEKVATGGFGGPYNEKVVSMTVYGGKLYAGTYNEYSGGEIWSWDGSSWEQVNTDGFGATGVYRIDSLASYGGRLYAGTGGSDGCKVWSTAAEGGPPYTDWTQVNTDGFGSDENHTVCAMAAFGGSLLAGTFNQTTGCEIWSWDGSSWDQANTDGFGDADNDKVDSMAVHGGRLYAAILQGTYSSSDIGCSIWSTSGTGGFPYSDWTQENTRGFGNDLNTEAPCMAVYYSNLFVGVNNRLQGCQVWNTTGSTWYLAEGATLGGFETWVLVQNPGTAPVHVDFTLNTDAGEVKPPELQGMEIPPGSRVSFNMGLFAQTFNLSTKVQATDGNVICERAMYYTPEYFPFRMLGHDSVGVNSPAPTWYMAEGATLGGFETWVLVQNPGTAPVHVDFTLNTDSGEKKPPELQGLEIPAGSRVSFNMGNYEQTYNLSTKVEATDGQVICERAMYWTPAGWPFRELGHDSVGVTSPAPTWYMAEGATMGGFETWVLVQNPGAAPVHVDFTLNTDAGEVKPPELQGMEIPAGSRVSFNMGLFAQTFNISTKVDCSDGDIICERAMYWTPEGQPDRELGHDSVGVTAPSAAWYMAEGATMGGFETWVLVQNPSAAPVRVDFTLNTDAGEVKPPELQGIEIPAGSRISFNMGLFAQTFNLSTKVTATDGDIICERAMYWTPEGGIYRELGHDSIGYTP